ncbi:unnamed protein product [Diamesa hyperborea]
MKITFVLCVVLFYGFEACAEKSGNSRTLMLNEQEARFAGSSLKAVLNMNTDRLFGPRTNKLRSFIGTFAITQRSSRCDDYEVKINADVQTSSNNNDNNGNGNRNRRDRVDGSY